MIDWLIDGFNVHLKAGISQLKLPHGTKLQKVEKRQTKKYKKWYDQKYR